MNCLNCKTELIGKYCHDCGQSQSSISSNFFDFFKKTTSDISGADSVFFRTLRCLVSSPGGLTKHWIDGKRIIYTSPIQVYFIIAGFFFLLNAYNPFIYFDVNERGVYSSLSGISTFFDLTPVQLETLQIKGISLTSYRDLVQSQISMALAPLLFVALIIFSLFTTLLTLDLRYKYEYHMVFSLHWCSFYLLLETIKRSFNLDGIGEIIVIGSGTLFLILSCKKIYCGWFRAVLTGITLQFGFLVFLGLWLMTIPLLIFP